MLNTPLEEIDFTKLEEFCRHWPEGVRTEYKRDLSFDIPKTVSSFANTLGGILVIGVDTKGKNTASFPINGMPSKNGIEESITQSCHDGIYPPVTPYVRIIPVPSETSNVVAIVKVSESTEAPHAIQNEERVYIRVNSITPPYKLAQIERIAFMLERRHSSEARRESLIEKGWGRISSRLTHHSQPRIRIAIGPRYPHKPLFDRDALKGLSNALIALPLFYNFVGHFRLTQDGIAGGMPKFSYVEINKYGYLFYEELLEASPVVEVFGQGEKNLQLDLVRIVLSISDVLRGAGIILSNHCANLGIKCSLSNVKEKMISPQGRNAMISRHDVLHSLDNEITAESEAVLETLHTQFSHHVVELIEQLMWPFNWNDDKVGQRTLAILQENHYL